MYPHEFVQTYVKNSDISISDVLGSNLMVVTCTCGEEDCPGWQMQPNEWVEERRRLGLLDASTKVYPPKEVYMGETPEEYYALHYPDMDPEELKIALAMDAAVPVARFICACGRRHEIEFHPPEHDLYATGSICACGNEIKFGE